MTFFSLRTFGTAVLSVLFLTLGINAQTIRDAFRGVKDSVVVIRTVQKEISSQPQQRGLVSLEGVGSGVLISSDGKILTAAHVVQSADSVAVEFTNDEIITAHVISSARFADVALLQLDRMPTKATVAVLGDSNKTEVGDEVFVVGAPLGLSHSLSVGYIGAKRPSRQQMGSFRNAEFLQTDAAINMGNSGGPMFNLKGEVVGIVSNILSRSGGFEGIGFVASSNIARELLIEQKSFWTGMEGILLEGEIAEMLNLPQSAGFLVQSVAENSPTARLGIRPGTLRAVIEGQELLLGGDIILSINGIAVITGEESFDSIFANISRLKKGDKLTSKILRAGQILELSTIIE